MTDAQAAATLVLDPPQGTEAAARSHMYALLTEAFAYPTDDAITRFLGGELLSEIHDTAAVLPEPIAVPAELAVAYGFDAAREMQILHTRLFEVSSGRPEVSLLERRHSERIEPEQKLWEDLLRFYTFFGLDFSEESIKEPPDHLLIELAFMHYLCFLEAGAQRGHDDLRRGQQDFLSNHLSTWTAHLANGLAELNDSGPYAALGKLLDDVVTADLKYLQEH